MPKNSREKGKRGEREWAKFLNLICPGANARRGQQFKGTPESPDVVSDLPFHWEVKRRERTAIYEAVRVARIEAGYGRWGAVAHRKNGERWVVSMDAEDFLRIVAHEFDQEIKTPPPQ